MKEYSYSRLCFKAEIIEPLNVADVFRIKTPKGIFQMTKGEFYNVFSNVTKTKSYREKGIYHYPTTPFKAMQFFRPTNNGEDS